MFENTPVVSEDCRSSFAAVAVEMLPEPCAANTRWCQSAPGAFADTQSALAEVEAPLGEGCGRGVPSPGPPIVTAHSLEWMRKPSGSYCTVTGVTGPEKKIGFFSSCDRHILMLYCHGCHIILGIILFPVPLLFRRYLSMIMCLTSLHFTSMLHYFTSISFTSLSLPVRI